MLVTLYGLALAVVAYGSVIYMGVMLEEMKERYENRKRNN